MSESPLYQQQDPEQDPSLEGEHPEAKVKKHLSTYWIWLIPLAALLLVGYLAFKFWAERGPLISITFETAEGLSPKQTEVKYKAVTLGRVEEVELSDDRSHVVAKVRMKDRAESMLTEETRFWVVRPRLGGGLRALQTGLQTLVSGAYVAMDPGPPKPDAEMKTHFEGLEAPPSMRSNQPGTVYYINASELGSLDSGSPIRYRDMDVGEVLSHRLEGENVLVRIFVESPYDEQVVDKTRFWNASGISIGSDGDGLNIELLSTRLLLSGGIAFDTPREAQDNPPAEAKATFQLFESEAEARIAFYPSIPYVSYFQSSVRGLSVGSEVHMYGRRIGAVTDIKLTRDPRPGQENHYAVRVEYVLQPKRIFPKQEHTGLEHDGIAKLVNNNLQVVLETNNLLTGEKALSLEYTSSKPETEIVKEGDAVVLPGKAQDLTELTTSLTSIASDIEQIPFAEIGRNLNSTLSSLDRTIGGPELKRALVSLDVTLREAQQLVREARAGIGPALEALPRMSQKLQNAAEQAEAMLGEEGYGANSSIHRNLKRMTDNIAEAARSIRLLSDHLHRHPESLITGRDKEE